jgi:uncharacterized YccA/Bax inhibitor family protein
VFREVEAGAAHYGVVPVENSTEGAVGRTLDLLRATPLFTKMIVIGTLGVMLTYLASMVLGLFGITILSPLHGSGMIGIGFSLLVVGLAAFNLILDFDMVENGVKNGAPKHMEWYAGYALLVTLVWLYIELLRLLAKLNSRK